jgi:prephenate dehydratase
MKVAIQGEAGSFSEEAALRLLGRGLEILGYRQFEEVFRAVESGGAECGVIPLENSLTGSIHRNYDLLRRSGLKIQRELYLPIQHNLIVVPGARFEDLETVISHPVALGQCERFFEVHPQLRMVPTHDTSGSVRELMESGSRTTAAIAGPRACEVFGGEVLRAGIQDNDANFTRFVQLGGTQAETPGPKKTSIVFSFSNVPGALFKSLSVFALRDIDLMKIESRPIHGRPWEYLFYLDFSGSSEDREVVNALNHLREFADEVEVLGCYSRDESVGSKGM